MTAMHGGASRILKDAALWGLLWLSFWGAVMLGIGALDPDSIDPGEPFAFLRVFGSMGVLTGLAFAGLVSVTSAPGSFSRAAGLGTLATALVQIMYLGHGDLGLLANLLQAFMFSLIGGIVTMLWFATARHLDARPSPSHS